MMKPVKVIYTVNGADYICSTEEQLKNFLNSGWVVAEEKAKKPKKSKQ